MVRGAMTLKTYTRSRSYNPPKNWNEVRREIDTLLKEGITDYRKRKYMTPHFYTIPLTKEKEKYPIMSALAPLIQNRYIGFFLMEQGRRKRGGGNTAVWVLPGVEE